MNDGRYHEKKEQREMEDVPKSEEAFIKGKRRGFLYCDDIQRHVVGYDGQLPVANTT